MNANTTIHIPLHIGSVVEIIYSLNTDEGGFINLISGKDIALHVNPRPFCKSTLRTHQLVLNAWHEGKWTGEERPENYPFPRPGKVHLTILIQEQHFLIEAHLEDATAEADIFTYSFKQRFKADIDHVEIQFDSLLELYVSTDPEAQ